MKKSIVLKAISLAFIFSSLSLADELEEKIVLKDETSKSLMKQDKIIGCDDTVKIKELKCSKERTPEDRDRDIDEIKAQLSQILKELAQLKKEKDIKAKDSKLDTIKQNIQKLTINTEKSTPQAYHKPKKIKVIQQNDNYVVVEVQSGESLSKYAQKYYGDARKYHRIYQANQDKISPDLQIYIGDRLIIPLNDSYNYHQKEPIREEIETQENETIITAPPVEIIQGTIMEEEIEPNSTETTLETSPEPKNSNLVDDLNKAIYVDE